MWMDETGASDEPPAGFATPDAAPLGPYSTTLADSAVDDVPAPAEYSPPKDPGPALSSVAPTPAAVRDPHLPFEAGQEDQMASVGQRDPREPFVNFTPQGAPDFAPPTGAPVTTANVAPVGNKWAPPTGQPVTAATSAAPFDPYAQRWASIQAGNAVPSTAFPTPSSAYPSPGGQRGSAIMAEYWAADALGKFWVVMKALPWPVLVILLAGLVIQQGNFAIWAICIAFLVCSANAKIAQQMLNRVFAIASAIYVFFWLATLISNATNWGYTIYNAFTMIGQWLCVVLMVASPIIVWRAFESKR